MNHNKFNIIYVGQIKQGYQKQQVIDDLSQLFKLSTEKATKLIQSKKEITLKTGTEHVKAYKFKSKLEDIGLQIRLQQAAVVTVASDPIESTDDKEGEVTTEQHHDMVLESLQQPSERQKGWGVEPVKTDYTDPNSDDKVEIVIESDTRADKLKTIGKWSLGIGGGLFIILKKFGLLKLLKFGILFSIASSVIGFDKEEICMGNKQCEVAVEDQIDDCWENSGLDDVDWDNISEEEYYAMKPHIEKDFIACFKYENTTERVFISPIEIRSSVYDLCNESGQSSCNKITEPQIQQCYEKNDIGDYVSEDTNDFYQVVNENFSVFQDFYNCFVDVNDNPVFDLSFSE